MPTSLAPALVTRSLDTQWNYERWCQLPADGQRYEVIDGVLYMTTAPSFFHQLLLSQPDPPQCDYRHTIHVAAHAQLISPTLPFRAMVADFFADAPDETV